MLGGQLAQRESTQGFQREMLGLKQTFQDQQRKASEEAQKALQDDKFAFLFVPRPFPQEHAIRY